MKSLKNILKGAKPAAAPKPAAKPASPPPAAADQPAAVKPLVDITKLKTDSLRKALNQETSMLPAVAMAYRAELEKRESAAKPIAEALAKIVTAKPAAAAPKPAAPKLAAKPAAAADKFKIHINSTGRVCFAKDAAERLLSAFKASDSKYCLVAVDKGIVRLDPQKKQIDGAVNVKFASGRPYVSATKQMKPLGFDGSRPYDIEAKPYGAAGFEFRLA